MTPEVERDKIRTKAQRFIDAVEEEQMGDEELAAAIESEAKYQAELKRQHEESQARKERIQQTLEKKRRASEAAGAEAEGE